MKICIATSRPVGERCIELIRPWLMTFGHELVGPDESDLFISIMYDKLIHAEFIARRPCFNFHPGILPEYRGAGAFTWAIINGEREAGVTLHQIDEDIDHGPIIEVRRFPITSHDTAETLFRQAEELMEQMIQMWLPLIVAGRIDPKPQQEAYAGIYYRKELERAKDLTRYVRAFSFEGKESAYFINSKGEKVYIHYS